MKILETGRVYLREYDNEDVARLSQILSDPRNMAYAPMAPTSDLSVAKDLIGWHRQSYAAHGFGAWAVILKESGAFVGQAGLLKHAEDVELFYSYLPEYWGRGLATEVAIACRDFAFERLGLDHLIAIIHPDNRAAVAVASKVGMMLSGRINLWDRENVLYRVERASVAPRQP